MSDLERFAAACALLLVAAASVRVAVDVARCLTARALARAFRSIVRKERR